MLSWVSLSLKILYTKTTFFTGTFHTTQPRKKERPGHISTCRNQASAWESYPRRLIWDANKGLGDFLLRPRVSFSLPSQRKCCFRKQTHRKLETSPPWEVSVPLYTFRLIIAQKIAEAENETIRYHGARCLRSAAMQKKTSELRLFFFKEGEKLVAFR